MKKPAKKSKAGRTIHRWLWPGGEVSFSKVAKCAKCGLKKKFIGRKPDAKGAHRAVNAKVYDTFFSKDGGTTWTGPHGQYKLPVPTCKAA